MNNFWDQSNFNLEDDRINFEIWRESPELQRQIQHPNQLTGPGSVGPQQAMLDSETQPGIDADFVLPWVPDLVGKDSDKENGLFIFGASYAGFIEEYSSRRACLPICEYVKAANLKDQGLVYFQKLFLKKVVEPDPDYYGKIERLMLSAGVNSSQIVLSDLCPNSLVKRGVGRNGRRKDNSKQPSNDRAKYFCKYVENDGVKKWTKRRILQSQSGHIIALGHIAEHGLLRIFDQMKAKIFHGNRQFNLPNWEIPQWVDKHADRDRTLSYWIINSTWWTVKIDNKEWRLLPIYHPARVDNNNHDPGYQQTSRVLVSFLN